MTFSSIANLTRSFAQNGRVDWIGIRTARRGPMTAFSHVSLSNDGLEGDHYHTGNHAGSGKRAVTLIQAEHLPAIAAFLNGVTVEPQQLRRNLVVSGINLIGLKSGKFQIGSAILEGSGICAPCSRMEEEFGKGGYSAVRGHGGICARVLRPGVIALHDSVVPLEE